MIVFALFVSLSGATLFASAPVDAATPTPPSCAAARLSHIAERSQAKGHMYNVPKAHLAEETRLCRSASPTCCSTVAEAAVEQFAGHELQRVVHNAFEPVATTFTHFEETFSALIDTALTSSRTRAIDVFNSAYADFFSNEALFDPLYDAMRKFIFTREGDVDAGLTKVRDDLVITAFAILLEPEVDGFTEAERTCILRYVERTGESESGVFNGKMAFIRRLVNRATNISTALAIAVDTGKRVVDLTQSLCPESECVRNFARTVHCSMCAGHVNAKPCRALCENMLPGCIGDLSALSEAFNDFLGKLSRLFIETGNVSPQSAMRDIGTEFSFAAMELSVSLPGNHGKLIRDACGFPARRKRSVLESLIFGPGSSGGGAPEAERTPPTAMDFKVQLDFARGAIVQFHDALQMLATNVCERISSDDDSACWNGERVGSYSAAKSRPEQADRPRQRLVNSLRMELQRASSIISNWVELDHWRTNPSRSPCSGPPAETETETTPTSASDCPEDDDDCVGNNARSGSGDDDPGLHSDFIAPIVNPTVPFRVRVPDGSADKPGVFRTVLVASLFVAALAWLM